MQLERSKIELDSGYIYWEEDENKILQSALKTPESYSKL